MGSYVKNDRGELVLDVKMNPIQRDKLPVYEKPAILWNKSYKII